MRIEMPRPCRLALAICLALGAASALPTPLVMPWLCLERCGDDSANISAELAAIAAHPSIINWASFEDFNLAADSALVKNNLSQVAAPLRAAGVATIAMVSSYPYPTNFLVWMRQVFASPQPFIDACVAAAQKESLSGFNIDWEPPSDAVPAPTPADALAYARFLDTLATALHAHGLLVTVDVATWSAVWNASAIGASAVDAVMTMGTYTDSWPEWQTQLAEALADIPLGKLVIGLETTRSDGSPFSAAELKERFDALRGAGVRRVGIWRSPIPDLWWPYLAAL